MSETKPNDPAILHRPTCQECGYQVENDCVLGAGCPECGTRIMPAEAIERIERLEQLVERQAAKLERQAAELERQAAELEAGRAKPPSAPVEGLTDAEGSTDGALQDQARAEAAASTPEEGGGDHAES